MISGSLGGKMISTLTWNARDVSSNLILGVIFPIFITFSGLTVQMLRSQMACGGYAAAATPQTVKTMWRPCGRPFKLTLTFIQKLQGHRP